MADPHSLPPPPDGDQNRASQTYGAVISLTILSTAIVITRVYIRFKLISKVGWDDYTIVLAQVMSPSSSMCQSLTFQQMMNLVYFVLQILMTVSGVGRHMYYIPLQKLVNAGLYYHIVEVLYNLTTAVTKISASLFVLRIMARGTSRRLRVSLYALMGSLGVICGGTAIVILVQCIPIQAGWDPRIKGKCLSLKQALGIGYAQNGKTC